VTEAPGAGAHSAPDADEVLVLRALGLGDALTAVPALRGLRRRWPQARLSLAAPAPVADWMVGLGLVDRAIATPGLGPIPWTDRPPDVAVNLHGRGPESHLELLALHPRALVAFANGEAGVEGPPWRPDEHEVDRWVRLVRSTGAECSPEDLRLPREATPREGAVVLHPGAASPSRRWPVDRWRAVAGALVRDGYEVVVTGVAAEAELCAAVAAEPGVSDCCGLDDLLSLAARVGGASLLVCGDTGVAHLATAIGTPSVLLFGPVSPALWGPRIEVDLHRVLWPENGRDDGRPGDPHGADLDPRLARTTVEQVLEAARALLRTPRPAVSRPPGRRPLGTSAR
jgi:ADP-heptose:LPS heptosyltransferase